MGFDLKIPKQLQDELRKVPHLRLLVPAAAAVVWVFGKIIRPGKERHAITAGDEEEELGEVVQVDVPAKAPRGVALPFAPPRPLRTTLLQATFPVPLARLWAHLMGGSSDGLVAFHTQLGEREIVLTPWRKSPDGRPTRLLRYVTPLSNPLGPSQCTNRERITAVHVGATAFVVSASCTSQGVPFAGKFANAVQWVAVADGPYATRLHITGECKFSAPVWGPLKGTISGESIKGMTKAYATLQTLLATRFGVKEASVVAPAAPAAADAGSLLSYLQTPQSNPAVMVMIVAMFVLMWRMALLDTLAIQMLRRLAQRAAS